MFVFYLCWFDHTHTHTSRHTQCYYCFYFLLLSFSLSWSEFHLHHSKRECVVMFYPRGTSLLCFISLLAPSLLSTAGVPAGWSLRSAQDNHSVRWYIQERLTVSFLFEKHKKVGVFFFFHYWFLFFYLVVLQRKFGACELIVTGNGISVALYKCFCVSQKFCATIKQSVNGYW